MKRPIFHIALCALAATMFCGCGSIEKSEAETAEVTAAQIEGRKEAKKFLNYKWIDTLELQNRLLEARSKQSKYATSKYPEAAAEYDSAFVSTLRTVNPEIARLLDKKE